MDFIKIKGAHLHNLKNIDINIPKNKLVVITGVSGSGKSTLAFDTIYAEGQRRYVESLSSYARQFLGKLEKPQVDDIKGLAPAIAIQQKVISTNPRSTVGTSTEIYDYLKLLFARIGKTISPISGEVVKKAEVFDAIDFLKTQNKDDTFILLSPQKIFNNRNWDDYLKILTSQGFVRLEIDGNIVTIEELISYNFIPNENMKINLVIDRFSMEEDENFIQRLADSVQTAFYEGNGEIIIKNTSTNIEKHFSTIFELDGIIFNEPTVQFFSFNNPFGACPNCEGYGKVIGIDENLVVPNKRLSIYEDAIVPWKGEKMNEWKRDFIKVSFKFDFPIHKPYFDLSEKNKKDLWDGNKNWVGLNYFFKMLEESAYKIQNRVILSRFRGKTTCPECLGKRLRQETNYVKINEFSINDLVDLPIDELSDIISSFKLSDYDIQIAKRILYEINSRLGFLKDVGLGYLSLNRASNTLSGGESQRINLATSLGSSLVGSIYILDEPSIGLHSKDTERLIDILKKLRDLGNTVIVVEHDEDVMKAADYIIDIGPEAGFLGGEVVFQGTYEELKHSNSLTAEYLTGRKKIEIPKNRRHPKKFIEIIGARQNNLKNIDVKLPLKCLTVITGVSGSGKSSLMKDILTPAIQKRLNYSVQEGEYKELRGQFKEIENIQLIDQNPIGKSTRSNPVTYIKAYDDIRDLYSKLKLSKINNFMPKHFSFNVEGGRCEACAGEGIVTVEMQFMADIELECEICNGKRFKKEVLDIEFEGKNIFDILNMTVDEALIFFERHFQNKIYYKIKPLQDVGLGYLKLGQSSNTLSGGEAQRIKLAFYLSLGQTLHKTLFIFDEPTTGLHFHDIKKLLKSFNALIEIGHSIMVIEHHPDVIKSADYIIDIGPDAGKHGGEVVAYGLPEDIIENKNSHTAKYLKEVL